MKLSPDYVLPPFVSRKSALFRLLIHLETVPGTMANIQTTNLRLMPKTNDGCQKNGITRYSLRTDPTPK